MRQSSCGMTRLTESRKKSCIDLALGRMGLNWEFVVSMLATETE